MSLKPILNLVTALAALGFVVLGVAASAPSSHFPAAARMSSALDDSQSDQISAIASR